MTNGTDRTSTNTSASSGTVADDSPTLLLGLGIGCTIIMSGVHRTPSGGESSDCLSSERDPIHGDQEEQAFHDVNCRVYSTSALSATPERRRLASVDFLTPPYQGAPGASEEASAGIRTSSAPDEVPQRKISDPILALLVDASVQSADSGGALRSPSVRSTEEQPVVSPPGSPAQAGRLGSADRAIQISHAGAVSCGKLQLQGDADVGALSEMSTSRDFERAHEATHGGRENEAIKAPMAVKEEEDVPDDEWRRYVVQAVVAP